jgi:hypothetical protein
MNPEEQFYQEQSQREAERQRREEANERESREREVRRESEERAREQRQEKRAEEQARVAGRLRAPGGQSYMAGGGPSFLLNITEGLSLPGETAKTETVKGGFVAVKYSPPIVNLMKDKSVAPGSVWEIEGIYLRLEPFFFLALGAPEPGNNTQIQISLTATMYRNTHPIWIDTAVILPHTQKTKPLEGLWSVGSTGQLLSLGTEFVAPIVLGSGEQISLELDYEGQAAWEPVGASFNFAALDTANPGIGAVRYNVAALPSQPTY